MHGFAALDREHRWRTAVFQQRGAWDHQCIGALVVVDADASEHARLQQSAPVEGTDHPESAAAQRFVAHRQAHLASLSELDGV